MMKSRPAHRTARVVVLALAAAGAACDDVLVSGPAQEVGNVDAVVGAAVAESDTGIVVNGQSVIRHPYNGQALWLDRFERYDLGGFPELDYAQDARHGLSWRISLTHGRREERGDSTIYSFFDHGEVTIAGAPLEKNTDLPHLGPSAPPIRFENFIRYSLSTSTQVVWMHGGSTTFEHAPFHDDLVAGQALAMETTGSDDVLPVEASFAARPFTVLTGVENGGVLDLRHGSVPVVDVGEPFILTFDRPLDATRGYIVLHPMHRHLQPGTRAAFIQTRSPSQRVVIPSHVLRQLVDGAAGPAAFRAIIVDILVEDDVFAGRFADAAPESGDFALPFVQRSETSVHLYLGGH